MGRMVALTALCAVLLTGCAAQPAAQEPDSSETVAAVRQLTATEAEQRALAPLRAGCTAVLTDEQLSVRAADGTSRSYYVFAISRADGSDAGKAAVDCMTGQVYHYLGDGVLEPYTSFLLYDGDRAGQDWPGVYADENGRTLTLVLQEDGSLSYTFSDGTAGTAMVSGDTAASADGMLTFLLEQGIVTAAGGSVTGNYIAQ